MSGYGGTAEPPIEGANGYALDDADAKRYEEINLRRPERPAQDYELGIQVLERVAFEEGHEGWVHAMQIRRDLTDVGGWLWMLQRLGLIRRQDPENELERPGFYLTRLGDRALLWQPDEPPSRQSLAEAIRRAKIRLARTG